MLNKKYLVSLGCCLSFSALAGGMGAAAPMVDMHPWSVVGSIGYTSYKNVAHGTGTTPVGRLAFGKDLFNLGKTLGAAGVSGDMFDVSGTHMGLELGIQNGNRMSIEASQTTLNAIGGLAPTTTAKPMLDLLATVQVAPMPSKTPLFLLAKGGVTYRQWQMDYNAVNNVTKYGGEIQAGIGMPVAEAATLSVLYQGLFGGNPAFTTNATTFTGHVNNIPVQNGLLLSLSMTL
jgi:hypothetical protein